MMFDFRNFRKLITMVACITIDCSAVMFITLPLPSNGQSRRDSDFWNDACTKHVIEVLDEQKIYITNHKSISDIRKNLSANLNGYSCRGLSITSLGVNKNIYSIYYNSA